MFAGSFFEYLHVSLNPPKWWNPAKLYKKKAPKKGREKETKCKDQSPGIQKSPKEVSHMTERKPLSTKTSTGRMKHIN
jgi:hypothetical protein